MKEEKYMFDNLTMEEVVDRVKEVRDNQKALKEQEDALKKRILADGREDIKPYYEDSS